VGGVRELVGDAGVLVPSKNPESLAKTMLEMMRKTNDERRKLGIAARQRISVRFSMDAKTDEWEALYRTIT